MCKIYLKRKDYKIDYERAISEAKEELKRKYPLAFFENPKRCEFRYSKRKISTTTIFKYSFLRHSKNFIIF
jgi:hypothetical protein